MMYTMIFKQTPPKTSFSLRKLFMTYQFSKLSEFILKKLGKKLKNDDSTDFDI